MSDPQDPGVPLSGKATVDALAGQWAKILCIIMLKHDLMDITITKEDTTRIDPDGTMPYCLVPGPGKTPFEIRIRLMKTEDAIKEARKYKGGFSKQ